MKRTLSLETCMDIFDWFDDDTYEYINHILLSKLDGEQRVRRTLPELAQASRLAGAHPRGHQGRLPDRASESTRLTMACGTGRNTRKGVAGATPSKSSKGGTRHAENHIHPQAQHA